MLGLCCGERGILLSCSVWASRWGGFSCCRAWALEHRLSSRGAGFSAPQHVRFSQTRYQTRVPCTGRRILNHWSTGEVPSINFSFQYNTNTERWQMLSIYIKSRKDPEITFLVVLIFIPSFIPKLTNIWTSNTEDSFCLFLNYIKVAWHNLWDCPTFSTVSVSTDTPNSSGWEFHSLHILSNIWDWDSFKILITEWVRVDVNWWFF